MSGLGRFRPSCQRIVRFSVDGVSLRLSSNSRPSPSSTSAVTRGDLRPTVLRQGADMEVSFSRFALGHFSTRRTLSVFSTSWRTLEEGFRLGSNGWTGSSPYSSANVPGGDVDNQGPVAVDSSSPMEEEHFHDLADDVLHHLQDKIEVYGEDLNVDGFDLDYSSGVLTVRLGDLGTYVMNKQTPNRQIWLSSPVSGPGRFDWSKSESSWIYRRKDVELVSLLEKEFSELLGTSIDLS